MNTFTHIAPQLPPAIDGVGDYCWNLWRHWPDETRWQFLALHGVAATREHWHEVEVGAFSANADSLERALETTERQTVVLHYVGYGFQPKGIPVWLPGALRRWREGRSSRRLVIMFHEMYARSSPLRSPFWVGPFARRIIHKLVSISDAWVTSCERYRHQLTTDFNASPETGRVIPIGSNIPVASDERVSRNATRSKLRVACFGLAKTRLWALERHWKLVREMNERRVLECVTLLGRQSGPEEEQAEKDFAQRIGSGVNWRRCFDFKSDEISRELCEHDLGLVANEPDILTKSGVFAALASHAVIPIVSTPRAVAFPKLVQGAVLANDDGEFIRSITRTLREPAQLETLRENLLVLSSRKLSWPSIAQRWSEILRPVSRDDTLSPEDRRLPIGEMEVPA